ncbi:hypothetical protein PAXRUDRAFT_825800 [Paxillus rubicundulus Ve08.2h10]|uniref:Uncharacterized protein n=1 Tax=Paxillus rubicundulus Ve08.2h10 TaxID=930991 RepID=A0A0D0E5E2_9AGAM|nr:hypothetical protein PAXRUDRAFT_825800 [Paxillus rubicundulus Ve08.2h10]
MLVILSCLPWCKKTSKSFHNFNNNDWASRRQGTYTINVSPSPTNFSIFSNQKNGSQVAPTVDKNPCSVKGYGSFDPKTPNISRI